MFPDDRYAQVDSPAVSTLRVDLQATLHVLHGAEEERLHCPRRHSAHEHLERVPSIQTRPALSGWLLFGRRPRPFRRRRRRHRRRRRMPLLLLPPSFGQQRLTPE